VEKALRKLAVESGRGIRETEKRKDTNLGGGKGRVGEKKCQKATPGTKALREGAGGKPLWVRGGVTITTWRKRGVKQKKKRRTEPIGTISLATRQQRKGTF